MNKLTDVDCIILVCSVFLLTAASARMRSFPMMSLCWLHAGVVVRSQDLDDHRCIRRERGIAMAVLGRVSVNSLIHAGILLAMSTILACYTIATSLGHVPLWLPMISDCAVYSPEKYLFRWGLVLTAGLFGLQGALIYGANRPYSGSKAALVVGLLGSFCLSIVGVVNEAENNTIHSSK